MEVNFQLHVQASLPMEKNPPSTHYGWVGCKDRMWRGEHLLPLPGIEPLFLSLPAHVYSKLLYFIILTGPDLRWEDVKWLNLAQNRVHLWAVVNTVMHLWVS
jgi:hypothetical protein